MTQNPPKAPWKNAVYEAADQFLRSLDTNGHITQVSSKDDKAVWRLTGLGHHKVDESTLTITPTFPASPARIEVNPSLCLVLPNVEISGAVCIPNPANGSMSVRDALALLLRIFEAEFIQRTPAQEITAFQQEGMTYWDIFAKQQAKQVKLNWINAFQAMPRSSSPRCYSGIWLSKHDRIVLGDKANRIANDLNAAQRHVGRAASPMLNITVQDLPIPDEFTPQTWPCTRQQIDHYLEQYPVSTCSTSTSARRKDSPLMVILRGPMYDVGYLLEQPESKPNKIQFVSMRRIDPMWVYGRDERPEVMNRQRCHVVVVGVGSLGSTVVDLLARAGVGKITIVDNDFLDTSNIARHVLGTASIGVGKVTELSNHVHRTVPHCDIVPEDKSFFDWFRPEKLRDVSILVDLTGEVGVRDIINHNLKSTTSAVAFGWLEPYSFAGHVCILPPGTPWQPHGTDDPTGAINAAVWPHEVMRKLPGCGAVFQGYSGTGASAVAAMIAERVMDYLDGRISSATVRSMVRNPQYLSGYPEQPQSMPWLTQLPTQLESSTLDRAFPIN